MFEWKYILGICLQERVTRDSLRPKADARNAWRQRGYNRIVDVANVVKTKDKIQNGYGLSKCTTQKVTTLVRHNDLCQDCY